MTNNASGEVTYPAEDGGRSDTARVLWYEEQYDEPFCTAEKSILGMISIGIKSRRQLAHCLAKSL